MGSQYRTGIYWHDDEQQKVRRGPRICMLPACLCIPVAASRRLHAVGLSHLATACPVTSASALPDASCRHAGTPTVTSVQVAQARLAAIPGCAVEAEPVREFWPAEEYHQQASQPAWSAHQHS